MPAENNNLFVCFRQLRIWTVQIINPYAALFKANKFLTIKVGPVYQLKD